MKKSRQEDTMHMQFGRLISQYEGYGKLKNVIRWSYMPMGEYRTPATARMLKSKGVKSGFPDYLFFIYSEKNGVDLLFLEFKTETGKQQQSQKDFQLAFMGAKNVEYEIVRSVEEAVKLLENLGILITK